MIEIIYNESGKKGSSVVVKPPKNIRQVGSPRGRHKIYMEDYVYTFLHAAAVEGEYQKRGAVLLGKSEIAQDIRYTFISGAIRCDDFIFQEDGIVFDESCWEYIYKEIKQYFDSQEIVGWFLGLTGFPLELTPVMESAHRKYFAGRDKVLFLAEPAEGEDVFFAYEQGILQKKEGYYIYYEKNLPMQEYMISSREKAGDFTIASEVSSVDDDEVSRAFFRNTDGAGGTHSGGSVPSGNADFSEVEFFSEETAPYETGKKETEPMTAAEQALQNYRNMLLERKEAHSQRKMGGLLYTAAASAMVILCVIGITTVNNYEKMKQVEATLAVISESSGQEENEKTPQSSGVTVETVPGQVTPEQEGENAAPDGEGGVAAPGTVDQQNQNDTATNPPADGQPVAGQTDGQQTGTTSPDGTNSPADQPDQVETSAQTYLEQGYYEVQPGDKLELICKKIYQDTTMLDKLCEANQIEDGDKIYPGQKLILP